MASEKLVKRMAGSIKANVRMLLGIVLILGVVLGLSFWRSGRVAAQAETSRMVPMRSIPAAETAPVANDEDSPESTIVISGNGAPITINDNTTASLYPSIATISDG